MTAHWPTPAGLHTSSAQLPVEGTLPSFDGATEWLNSPPLTPSGLRGTVVLVGFWTYTCVNWLRQLPYLRAWAQKYADRGLVVIGVHTPEFSFERDLDNVLRAVADSGIDYPVAVDSDYRVWNAFANHYWPALYFADAQGRIRHHQFGEGEYQRSEMVIQRLLAEAGSSGWDQGPAPVDARGAQAPADWADVRSAENYTGYQRTEGVNLVMGPAGPGTPAPFRVRIDGQPPAAAHGADTDGEGNGTVVEPRMYQLVRQLGPIADAGVEITFADAGAQVYVVTFG
jgi:thiol-disulfide isomerase/thioredoxin